MKMNLYLVILFIGLIVSTMSNYAQSTAKPSRFSVEEAVSFALSNSPVLTNSARDVEIAKKRIWESTATGLPQASLSSSYSYSPKLAGISTIFAGSDTTGGGGSPSPFPFQFNPDDLKTSFNLSIQVSQLIFSGQYIVGLRASRAYAGMAELNNTKSEIDIRQSITNTYFSGLILRQSKSILDSSLAVTERTYYEAQKMFENGMVEITDVDQLKILSTNIRNDLRSIELQTVITDRLLKFQMGFPVDDTIELTDLLLPKVETMTLEAALLDSFDVQSNVEYNILSTYEKLMKLNMQATQSQFLPTVAGFYQRYEDFDDNFFNDMSPNMFGLTLSLPLWSSGQRLSQVGQRKLEYLQAQTNKNMMADNLNIQFKSAVNAYLTARDVYVAQKENRDLAWRIYQRSIKRFREGMGSSLDLNQTQGQYFAAEGGYYNAIMTLVSARTTLESLLTKTN